ncbi:MAG: hypothetical protein PVJ45_05035 [Desulfobacterales bacterium]|jgi:hypothetical protein
MKLKRRKPDDSTETDNALKQIIKHFKGNKAGSKMILPYLFAQQPAFCYYKKYNSLNDESINFETIDGNGPWIKP